MVIQHWVKGHHPATKHSHLGSTYGVNGHSFNGFWNTRSQNLKKKKKEVDMKKF